jgi:hypothetical protein
VTRDHFLDLARTYLLPVIALAAGAALVSWLAREPAPTPPETAPTTAPSAAPTLNHALLSSR